ncbi:MAG: 30S ribosomal protein S14 [Candidatus Kapaibacteriota bacterium]
MATKAVIARNLKRIKLVEKYKQRREALKEAGDYLGLQKLPKNSSPVRLRNRCGVTGRGRGVYRKFMLCRNVLRQMALEGKIPGLRKASW